ncbi:MucBP domain-containing protein [Enterococcus termitis]|uniref:Internalin n=1 Tax=Enterococcus termitis TaxID=332950 RepID=A0A1E5H4E6_9ENTE|nr:MucBP domain-containing protein [Enterococcus termitis]OEG19715.1 internalin [Enterococcus termitis]OJG97034.1 hypothetical protein RV18_GL001183 [Enterococcus termitis]
MKRTNSRTIHTRKNIHKLLLLSLLTPTLLSPSLVFAEEFSADTEPTANSQTQESEDMANDFTKMSSSAATETSSIDASTETTSTTVEEPPASLTSSEPIAETTTETIPETPATFSNDLVVIPDPALKQEILKTLGLPTDSELTTTDMENLTDLYLYSAQISSLSGLETAVNLRTIYMNTDNAITDFSPLEKLTALTFVTLQTKSLTSTNFPDLRNSPGITNLSLGSTSIDDAILPKIAQMSGLTRIYLDSNMLITTIEPLKVLPNLRSLSVQFCGITDFTVIKDFPALNDLAAFGQNTGRNDLPTAIGRSSLDYDSEKQTLFLPFSMMPNRMTNFDGYIPPFTTSPTSSNTYLDFNGTQLPADRLQIDDQGITILNVTADEFRSINSFEYNARLNNPVGSYATPDGFGFYAISAGTYLHQFNVLEDGQPVTIHYRDTDGNELLPSQTLNGLVSETFDVPIQTIPKYDLVETIGNTSGVFSDQEQEIIFIYEKIEDTIIKEKGRVLVHYVDTDNNTIKDPAILSGKVGEAFTVKKPSIEGFTFKEIRGNERGIFSKEDQVLTYVYAKTEGKVEEITPAKPSDPKEPSKTREKKPVKTTVTPTTNSTKTKESQKKTTTTIFPATGEKTNASWLWLGFALLISAYSFFSFKKAKQHRK